MWKHLAGCGVGVLVVAGIYAITRGAVPGGAVLIALACPVTMILLMKFMGGHNHSAEEHGRGDDASDVDEGPRASRE